MQMDNTELDAYESIIQNLLVLNKKAGETKPEEKEAIRAILHNISAQRDCVCNPDEFLVSSISACATFGCN